MIIIMEEFVRNALQESASVKRALAQTHTADIVQAAECITAMFLRGGKLLLAGNGGSAADAQHIAAEFVGHFKEDRPPLPAIALTTDTSALTAIGNDYGFDNVFSRQIEALGQAGKDVLVLISTSGRSMNIQKAAATAQKHNIKIIGFLGKGGGDIKNMADIAIIVPSDDTQHIQEAHITIGHIICDIVEKRLAEENNKKEQKTNAGAQMDSVEMRTHIVQERRAVFLDRDGVITKEPPHYAHRLDQLELVPRAAHAIRMLNEYGFLTVVVSNQAGVAHGFFEENDTNIFNRGLEYILKEQGAHLDALYYCPHHPEAKREAYRKACDCRKPQSGMLTRAARELSIDFESSFMIGDKWTDIEAAKKAGCKSIMVRTGQGEEQWAKCKNAQVDYRAADIYEAAEWIIHTAGGKT